MRPLPSFVAVFAAVVVTVSSTALLLAGSTGAQPAGAQPAGAQVMAAVRSTTTTGATDLAASVGSLLMAGEVAARAVSSIDLASFVDLEIYELGNQAVIRALIAARRRGDLVQVILDPTEYESIAAARLLRRGGVSVRTLAVPDGIDHVKLLVTNLAVVTGGVNLGAASPYTTDLDVVLPTADVSDAKAVFAADWASAGRARAPAGGSFGPFVTGAAIEPSIGRILARATRSCTVLANYMTDSEVEDALIAAHRRGVRIDVLLNPTGYGASTAKTVLGVAGIGVRLAPKYPYLHAKVIACGREAIVGSANFSYDGMAVNHELDVVLAGTLAAQITARAERLAAVP